MKHTIRKSLENKLTKLREEGWTEVKKDWQYTYFSKDGEYILVDLNDRENRSWGISDISQLMDLGLFDTDNIKAQLKALAMGVIELKKDIENVRDNLRNV